MTTQKSSIPPMMVHSSILFPLVVIFMWMTHISQSCPNNCSCSVDKTWDKGTKLKGSLFINCDEAGIYLPLQEDFYSVDRRLVIKLSMKNNKISSVRPNDFNKFRQLKFLDLSHNQIGRIPVGSFNNLLLKVLLLENNHLPEMITGSLPPSLEELSLRQNFLLVIPSAVTSLHKLLTLDLSRNKIIEIQEGDLQGLENLISLNLARNRITAVGDRSLMRLQSIQKIDLSDNKLIEIPSAILFCPTLKKLCLAGNYISWISADSLQGLHSLQDLSLDKNPLKDTHVDAFRELPALKKLSLKESREMTVFPNLNKTSNLEAIRIDRASLKSVPDDICKMEPKLKSLILHKNEISKIPNLRHCHQLKLLDLSNNAIEEIQDFAFQTQSSLHDLLLQNNYIEKIHQKSFIGLKKLQILNLEYNLISHIHPDAFLPLEGLEDINLGNNFFPELPNRGFGNIVSIKAHNNKFLKIFPGRDSFPNVLFLTLSYAYHCCPFLGTSDNPTRGESINESVIFSTEDLKRLNPSWNVSSLWQDIDFDDLWRNLAEKSSMVNELPVVSEIWSPTLAPYLRTIECIPKPGPFMPCKDLFDWWTLRCGVWIVFLLALLGNGAVVVVLVFARSKMDVPRFLVTNLAMADFFMGIYLGFLAVVDASTLGNFKMHAIPWQMSVGCQVAGFFGVLSSELSVYTLTVITLERNYAITHAMHLNKRLSLRHAAYIMILGWLFAATMAYLPIMEISDYRKFAVCLPFETEGGGIIYVIFLMFINGLAFLILMGCYLKIYCAIRGSQAWNSNDSRIAKRMALLVFTDFLCWAPIAFFSLTAAFGLQLISLEEAKIFTVFVFPLNSCCNPFLYALLTKQFKKDCVMLCKTIEESRVTRGIGRCRHSSNFSNRQTPVNTNSAVEQTSKGFHQKCGCQSKKKSRAKFRSRLRLAALKYLFCHKEVAERNSSRDFPCQQSKNCPSKGKRQASLSSETYSSSWSDAFKKSNMALSLRLLEKRKPNSWYLSRKPSQESNLSSSRNDSSATTASTSTWRISRSSVSSDISSGASRGLAKGDSQSTMKISSIRDRRAENRSFVSGRSLQHPTVIVMQNSNSPGSWVSSLIRGKPKLQRQTAVEKECYYPNKSDIEITAVCPLHQRGDNLSCVYEQESIEEEEAVPFPEPSVTYLTPNYQGDGNTITFVPRKVSTISSRSVSMNIEREDSSPLLENVLKNAHEIIVTKDKILMRDGRCVSLTVLPQYPVTCLSHRCPSDGQLCVKKGRRKNDLAKSAECISLFYSSELKEIIPSHTSPICTETTALMVSDSEEENNDDVFVEDCKKKPLETHFPIAEELGEDGNFYRKV